MEKTSTHTKAQAAARVALLGKYSVLGSWRKVENELGINRGLLCNIASGKRQASDRVLARLGIEYVHFVAVAPCAHCGEAHIRKSCPKRKAEGKPRPRRVRYSESAVSALVAAYQRAVLGVLLGAR